MGVASGVLFLALCCVVINAAPFEISNGKSVGKLGHRISFSFNDGVKGDTKFSNRCLQDS